MGATLTLSSTTTSSISARYSFTSQSPQITKVTCFCEEYNPTGTVYTAKQIPISATTSYSGSVTWTGLASNRQHKLYVRSYSSTGAVVNTTNIIYPYTSSPSPSPSPSPPSDDHGDTMATASTVSINSSTGNGSISGKIETGGDVDFFKFTVPSGKSGTYHIYTTGNMDTKGYLYNSSGSQLAYNDDNPNITTGTNFGIEYTLSASTTYYVKVTGYNSTTTGSYTLHIARQVTDDHGDTMATATTLSLNSTGYGYIGGEIETGGDVDFFKFTTPSSKGGKYHIYTTGSMDTKGYLYDSSGSQLAYNDDNPSITTGTNFGIEYTLSASTTYYVKVTGYSTTTTGSYTLYVSRQVTDDHGNTPSTATLISLPSAGRTGTYSGSIEESGDVDYFKFTTSVAGTYKIYTTGSLDTVGYLYDSSLTQIAYNDDNSSMGGGTNFGFEVSLSANATYYVQVRAYSSNTGDYTLNITVPLSPPANMSAITVGTKTPTSIQVLWSSVTGATNYCLEVYKYNTTTLVKSDYNIASNQTSYTITGLTANTSYDIKMYPKNSSGNGAHTKITNISTLSGLPATPANFRVTTPKLTDGFHTLWDSVTGATSYSIEAYHASTNTLVYSNYNVTTTSHQITGLNEYVTYNLKLWAKNQYGNSTAVWLNSQKTKDGTPPVINFNSTSGQGKIYASWSATDAHSGIRDTSKFSVYIGTANGASSTMVHKQYTDNYYFTFISDASGNEFVHGAKYWIKVYAYDNEGNSSMTSAQITYTRARPNNWSWTTSKVTGQALVVTATEWNSLCTRINQFRQYKGLDNYSFTTVSKGDVITATVVNQARTAIASMTTNGLPSTVSKGTKITASFFNNLVSALNGIK